METSVSASHLQIHLKRFFSIFSPGLAVMVQIQIIIIIIIEF